MFISSKQYKASPRQLTELPSKRTPDYFIG